MANNTWGLHLDVNQKVQTWTNEIKHHASIATTQPHVAYTAFTHRLLSRWSYLQQTIPDIQDLLLPLENAICQHFIPALTGCPPSSAIQRKLLALPVRLGGLGLSNPVASSPAAFQASENLTSPLVALIILQNTPQTCSCGSQFTVDHAMVCHMGGFPTIRHNEIRDMTASLLTEVCHNVATEPPL